MATAIGTISDARAPFLRRGKNGACADANTGMSTIAAALRPVPIPRREALTRDPAAQAFLLLRIAFTVAPILFGLDKFANVLTDDWTKYLASEFNNLLPGSAADGHAHRRRRRDRRGPRRRDRPALRRLLVAAWLGGIILNLLLVGGYGDIALRDFGLMLGALTLTRLASAHAVRVACSHMRDTPAVPNSRTRVTASRSSTSVSSSSPSPAWRRTMPSGSTIRLRPRPAGAAALTRRRRAG